MYPTRVAACDDCTWVLVRNNDARCASAIILATEDSQALCTQGVLAHLHLASAQILALVQFGLVEQCILLGWTY